MVQAKIMPHEISLDLGDMPIDGSTIGQQLNKLKLDGTAISDAALKSQSATPTFVQSLSLRDTKITDAGVSLVRTRFNVNNELILGGPLITDAGLLKLGKSFLRTLRLPAENVTGSCFENWAPFVYHLDLSHSGLGTRTQAD